MHQLWLTITLIIIQIKLNYGRNRLDADCDPEFDKKFIQPIYNSKDASSLLEAIANWRKVVENNKGALTCFGDRGFQDAITTDRVYYSEKCDYETKKCTCHNTEPMIQQRNPRDGCVYVDAEFGSPCNIAQMKVVNDDPEKDYTIFYNKMKTFKKMNPEQLKIILNGRQNAFETWAEAPWHARQICHTMDKNLDCGSYGQCMCLNVAPYFEYRQKGKKCIALKGSICKFETRGMDSTTGSYYSDDMLVPIQEAECERGSNCVLNVRMKEYALYLCEEPAKTQTNGTKAAEKVAISKTQAQGNKMDAKTNGKNAPNDGARGKLESTKGGKIKKQNLNQDYEKFITILDYNFNVINQISHLMCFN